MRRSRVGIYVLTPKLWLGIKLTSEVACMASSNLPAASYGVMAYGLVLALGLRVQRRLLTWGLRQSFGIGFWSLALELGSRV